MSFDKCPFCRGDGYVDRGSGGLKPCIICNGPLTGTTKPFPPATPPGIGSQPLPGQTVVFRPLTEADVRRIVREEIERATKDQAP